MKSLSVPIIWKEKMTAEDIRRMIAIGNLSNKRNKAKKTSAWDKVWAAHRVCEAALQAYPQPGKKQRAYQAALRKEWCVNYDTNDRTARGYFNIGKRMGKIWDLLADIFQGHFQGKKKNLQKPESVHHFTNMNHLEDGALEAWLTLVVAGELDLKTFADRLDHIRLGNSAKKALMEHLQVVQGWESDYDPSRDVRAAWKQLIQECPPLNDEAFLDNGVKYASQISKKKGIGFPGSWLDYGLNLFEMHLHKEEMQVIFCFLFFFLLILNCPMSRSYAPTEYV